MSDNPNPTPNNPSPPKKREASTYYGQSSAHPKVRGRQRKKQSQFYLPVWSILFMFLIVIFLVGLLITFVIVSGGNQAPAAPPVIKVITADPAQLNQSIPTLSAQTLLATPTLPEGFNPGESILQGPTLEAVVFTATPESIAIGKQILVVDVGSNELNVRDIPGIQGSQIVFLAKDGAIFNIVEGPLQGDGFTWWKIQDPANPNLSGWAAANFLEVIAADV